MNLSFSVGLKESGGHTLTPWEIPFKITKGQHCKLGIACRDSGGKPVTLTLYTVKLRIPQGDGTTIAKTATAVDNTKGESEVILLPSDTSTLGIGSNQNLEIEIHLTATPTTTSFHSALAAFSVLGTLLPAPL